MEYGFIPDPTRIGVEFLRVFDTTNTVFNEINEDEIIFDIFENKNKYEYDILKYENNETNDSMYILFLIYGVIPLLIICITKNRFDISKFVNIY